MVSIFPLTFTQIPNIPFVFLNSDKKRDEALEDPR